MSDEISRIKIRARVPEVAKALCKSEYTIRRMAKKGLLPSARRIGKEWTFDIERLNRWLNRY